MANALATTHPDPSPEPHGHIARYRGLTMVYSPAEALQRLHELQAVVAKVMVVGVDYGPIPGAGNKDCLFQPGAQKLCEIYGFATRFDDVLSLEDWDKGFFFYRKRCVLTDRRDESFVGEGRGSCNSREDRYAWRWVDERALPPGLDPKTLKAKTKDTRNGPWTQYRVPNDDLFSLVNTIEKMACKRALIHAVIAATRASGIFTQDVEDMPAEAFGTASIERSWERVEAAADAVAAVAVGTTTIEPPAKTPDRVRSKLGVRSAKRERPAPDPDAGPPPKAFETLWEEFLALPDGDVGVVRAFWVANKASIDALGTERYDELVAAATTKGGAK